MPDPSSPRNHSPIPAKTVTCAALGRGGVRAGGGRVPSNNVQKFREALMLSKAELARKSGLSTLTIDRVEAGRPCRLDTKRKILLALSLRITDKDQVFSPASARESADAVPPGDGRALNAAEAD